MAHFHLLEGSMLKCSSQRKFLFVQKHAFTGKGRQKSGVDETTRQNTLITL